MGSFRRYDRRCKRQTGGRNAFHKHAYGEQDWSVCWCPLVAFDFLRMLAVRIPIIVGHVKAAHTGVCSGVEMLKDAGRMKMGADA